MADNKLETTESDPSATPVDNEQTSGSVDASVKSVEQAIGVPAGTVDDAIVKVKEANKTPTAGEEAEFPVKQAVKAVTAEDKVEAPLKSATRTTGHEASPLNGESSNAKVESSKGGEESIRKTETSTSAGSSTHEKLRSNRERKPGNQKPKVDYSKNVKTDFTSQPESSDPVEIRKQIEFYFSDSNLSTDKFLYSKVEGPLNLPVPISVIHSFKRMKHFQPLSAIVTALKESTVLDVVENDSCIRRKIPLSETFKDKPIEEVQKVFEDEAMARTIYAKGFGKEKSGTQFELEAFFQKYGATNSVRLRRAHDKTFKGSVFVEFDCEETAKTFLALDPIPQWNGQDLLMKSKKQYCDEKVDDIAAGKIDAKHWGDKSSEQNGRDRDWRDRRADDQKRGFRGDRRDRGHKGYGSSGRGGRGERGGRGGRGGRNRNEEREINLRADGVPKISVPEGYANVDRSQPDKVKVDNVNESGSAKTNGHRETGDAMALDAAENSKKRGREDDASAEVQGSVKKVDAKDES